MELAEGVGAKLGQGAVCAIVCLACLLMPASLMWLIWGGIILDRASDLDGVSTCRAEDFWWHMFAAYVWTGCIFVFGCLAQCCIPLCTKSTAEESKGLATMATFTLHSLFIWAWSTYALILWHQFDNTPGHWSEAGLDADSTCKDFLTHTSKHQDFTTLWQISTIWYWMWCLLGPCLIITIYIAAFSKAVLTSTNLSTTSEEDLRDSLLRPTAHKQRDAQL